MLLVAFVLFSLYSALWCGGVAFVVVSRLGPLYDVLLILYLCFGATKFNLTKKKKLKETLK